MILKPREINKLLFVDSTSYLADNASSNYINTTF